MTDNPSWEEFIIGDLGTVVTGKTPPTSNSAFFGGVIPFITPTDMDERRIILTTERYLTEIGVLAVKGSRIPSGAVMVSCIGSQMGKVAIAGKPCVTNQQINSIIISPEYSKLFIYYSLLLQREEIRSLGAGSAVPILNKSDFSKLPIYVPSLPEQCAIASILGALDDKIELNRRMNATLEAMAQAIFLQWFVENEEVERWKEGKFTQIADISRDSINPGHFPVEEFNYYSIPIFDEKHYPQKEFGSEIKSNKYIVPPHCILISKLNPEIQRIWLPYQIVGRSICSTEFIVNIPKDYFTVEYLYGLFHSQSFQDKFSGMVTGTSGSHQRVKPEYLLEFDIEIPTRDLVCRYTEVVKPLLQKIQQNIWESRTLASLRDILLPKLMRGEVSVKQGEI
jgi:type I restriction enzyme, S subunit